MKSENSFLTLTFLLVAGLSWPVANNLFFSQPTKPVQKLKASASTPVAVAGRGPANIATSPTAAPALNFAKSLTADIGCKTEQSLGEVLGHHVRLTGSLCLQDETLTVKNLTNGYTASLIFFKKKGFTTDFIDLSEGVNDIEITRVNSAGQLQTQNVKVNRQPAQAVEDSQ